MDSSFVPMDIGTTENGKAPPVPYFSELRYSAGLKKLRRALKTTGGRI